MTGIPCRLCFIDHGRSLGRLLRRDHKDVDALGQQIVHVIRLPAGIIVRDGDHALDVHLLAVCVKGIAIPLPALFLHGRHGETDFYLSIWIGRSVTRLSCCRVAIAIRARTSE